MPVPVELSRRDGIELVRTGSFQTLTGSWSPTPADIQAAVEAMGCPAIRKPVIRLGHTDQRFVGDGEPALGWFENLRATDDGHTLVADQVTLPWLASVQAAAYPSRSIEGNYNHRCSEGHLHPFVIHTVALLGVTPPGVQTLRSLNDLPDMLGVAASGEVPDGARHVQVTVLAAADDTEPEHTRAMVALIPTVEDAARLAVVGGEPADQLHVTLAYLGDAADLDAAARQDIIDTVTTAANGLPQITADVFSAAAFNPGGTNDREPCLVYLCSGDLLDAVHSYIGTPEPAGAPIPEQHAPWIPHLTAAYSSNLGLLDELAAQMGPVTFDTLRIALGGQHIDIPLIGEPDDISDDSDVAAAAGNTEELKKYWLAGPGLNKWATARHPWTTLYRLLRKHIKNADEAKRTASDWYRLHFGHMPNQKVTAAGHFDPNEHRDGHGRWSDGGAVGAVAKPVKLRGPHGESAEFSVDGDGSITMNIPGDGDDGHPDTVRLAPTDAAELGGEMDAMATLRTAYLRKAQAAWDAVDEHPPGTPEYQAAVDAWHELGGDGQRITGGELPGDTGTLVYEMRMGEEVNDTHFLVGIRPPGVDPDDFDLPDEAASGGSGVELTTTAFQRLRRTLNADRVAASGSGSLHPDSSAAEPEPVNTDPKEDLVSDLSAFRSRLGLEDTADEQAILSALDDLKAKADTPTPAEPTPEMVAASAAAVEKAAQAEAEKDELRKEVTVLASRMEQVTTELAAAKAEKAATVKASVFDAAVKDGKIKPADREEWEKDYDDAPAAVTRVLASIAPGTAVPVAASGSIGSPDPTGGSDADWNDIVARLDGPHASKAV